MFDMQLDSLTSAPFVAHIGKFLTVEADQGTMEVEVLSVKESPASAGPNSKRTPFCVVLRGPLTPFLEDGCFNLCAQGVDGWRLDGVFINRIVPSVNTDGKGAFYQLAFA